MKANKWKFFSNPQHSCLLLILLMANLAFSQATIWDGTADTTWYTSNKTASEFTITTAEQLAGLAKLVNGGTGNGTYNMSGKTITLGNDIAFNDTTGWQNWENNTPANVWTAIGASSYHFKGTFDGNGHVISGVYYQCLFGQTGGTVKNIGVEASYIKTGGGLVGYNDSSGTVSNSYATGAVSGNSNVGGLVGQNYGTVSNSYATGAVSGDRYVGGLVGYNSNYGTVSNSYATGTVSGLSGTVGGLVGYNGSYSTVRNSYATGAVSGDGNDGGLVGNNVGTVSNSYYDKEASGHNDINKGEGKTTAEMQSEEFVKILNISASFLSMNTWVYSIGDYPKLSNQTADALNISDYFASGDGTQSNPYIIENKQQLIYFSLIVNYGNDFNGETIMLGNDIALNDTTGWQNWENNTPANVWTGIGTYYNKFRGTFDGSGYVVSGVYMNFEINYQGFFKNINNGGTIKNLGIEAFYIKGNYYVGGLVGLNDSGTVSNSYATGTVSGSRYVGGLVGYNNNSGTVSNSYSTGKVSGSRYVGGLVGYNNNSGTVSNSYSTGKVSGSGADVGGLMGDNNGTVSNSYYDSQTSGRSDYIGEGKTTAEMKTQSTYIDWDFEEIWSMDPIINKGYPVFQSQIARIDKQFISASQVYFASQRLKNDSIPTTIVLYYGNPVEPVLDSVTLNGKKLTEGIDYEITYANNLAVGTAKIIIEGKGDYIGTKILDFYITEHRDIANATVADIPDQIHTGSAINYKPVIKDFGEAVTLIENTDYELSYSNNINEGYATINIVGLGVYDGSSTSVEFKIVGENDLSGKATIAFANPPVYYTYSGEKYTPDITVTHFEDGILEESKDYAVFYGDNTNAGTGTVTAAGIGNYTGELQIDFAIIAKQLEVEWESNRVFEYNKMVQYPKASIEENIQFNVLNTHSTAGVYSGSDAALFTLTNNIDLQNYDIINPTADYEIAKKDLSVRFLVSNPAEDFDANQDTVWVPTEIFRDSVLLHGTLLSLLSYDGFATNTETNESDNASVLSGVPAIEIRYSKDENFSAFFKRVETTQTATAEINADSVTADNYTILSRNVVVMETVSEDDESEIDLSLQPPSLSSAGPFRAWQTMNGTLNVDLGYSPASPVLLEVRDLKGKLVTAENISTRFASVKMNAASGVYVLKAGNRNAVAVVK